MTLPSLLLMASMATNGINILGTNDTKTAYFFSTNGFSSSLVAFSPQRSNRVPISILGKSETNVIHGARVVASHDYRPICIYMDTNEFLSVSFVDENGKPRTFKSKTPMIEVKEKK